MTGLTYLSFSKKVNRFLTFKKKGKKRKVELPDSCLPFQYDIHETQARGTYSDTTCLHKTNQKWQT